MGSPGPLKSCVRMACEVDPSLQLLVIAALLAVVGQQLVWKLIDSDLPASFCQETLLIRTKWLSSFLCLSSLPTPGCNPVQPDWQLCSPSQGLRGPPGFWLAEWQPLLTVSPSSCWLSVGDRGGPRLFVACLLSLSCFILSFYFLVFRSWTVLPHTLVLVQVNRF